MCIYNLNLKYKKYIPKKNILLSKVIFQVHYNSGTTLLSGMKDSKKKTQ